MKLDSGGGDEEGGLLLCILCTSQNVKHFGQLHEVNFFPAPLHHHNRMDCRDWMDGCAGGVRKGKVQRGRRAEGAGFGASWCLHHHHQSERLRRVLNIYVI
jgi:hypothetical protein